MFHAVIIERRKFGSVGFTETYLFNESDFDNSILIIKNLMHSSKEIPFVTMNYIIGEVIYGGRITDFWDNRIMTATLNNFIKE